MGYVAKFVAHDHQICGCRASPPLDNIVDFKMAIAILATLKISDWLIDWVIKARVKNQIISSRTNTCPFSAFTVNWPMKISASWLLGILLVNVVWQSTAWSTLWVSQSFGLSHNDAQDKDDWKLRIMGTTS